MDQPPSPHTYPTYVTETNKTPLIQVITWILLSFAIVSVGCRALTKTLVIRFYGADDIFVPAALVFLISQSIAVTIQTTNGFGRPTEDLGPDHVASILKAKYAADLLYIPALFFSKLPTLVLLSFISPITCYRVFLHGIGFVICAWALTSEFVTAFQCAPLETWNIYQGRCIDRVAWWTYFELVNAATDLCLVILPLFVVYRVRTPFDKKLSVGIIFSFRLLDVAAIICKIYFLYYSPNSALPDDELFNTWAITLCTQVIQCCSVLSACILYLRPFLEALTSGFIHGDDLRRRGQVKPKKAARSRRTRVAIGLEMAMTSTGRADSEELDSTVVTIDHGEARGPIRDRGRKPRRAGSEPYDAVGVDILADGADHGLEPASPGPSTAQGAPTEGRVRWSAGTGADRRHGDLNHDGESEREDETDEIDARGRSPVA